MARSAAVLDGTGRMVIAPITTTDGDVASPPVDNSPPRRNTSPIKSMSGAAAGTGASDRE